MLLCHGEGEGSRQVNTKQEGFSVIPGAAAIQYHTKEEKENQFQTDV